MRGKLESFASNPQPAETIDQPDLQTEKEVLLDEKKLAFAEAKIRRETTTDTSDSLEEAMQELIAAQTAVLMDKMIRDKSDGLPSIEELARGSYQEFHTIETEYVPSVNKKSLESRHRIRKVIQRAGEWFNNDKDSRLVKGLKNTGLSVGVGLLGSATGVVWPITTGVVVVAKVGMQREVAIKNNGDKERTMDQTEDEHVESMLDDVVAVSKRGSMSQVIEYSLQRLAEKSVADSNERQNALVSSVGSVALKGAIGAFIGHEIGEHLALGDKIKDAFGYIKNSPLLDIAKGASRAGMNETGKAFAESSLPETAHVIAQYGVSEASEMIASSPLPEVAGTALQYSVNTVRDRFTDTTSAVESADAEVVDYQPDPLMPESVFEPTINVPDTDSAYDPQFEQPTPEAPVEVVPSTGDMDMSANSIDSVHATAESPAQITVTFDDYPELSTSTDIVSTDASTEMVTVDLTEIGGTEDAASIPADPGLSIDTQQIIIEHDLTMAPDSVLERAQDILLENSNEAELPSEPELPIEAEIPSEASFTIEAGHGVTNELQEYFVSAGYTDAAPDQLLEAYRGLIDTVGPNNVFIDGDGTPISLVWSADTNEWHIPGPMENVRFTTDAGTFLESYGSENLSSTIRQAA